MPIRNQLALVFVLLGVVVVSATPISHDIMQPTIHVNRLAQTVKTISSKQKVMIKFPSTNYQISGKVYETSESLLSQHLHDPKAYQQSVSCVFYPTDLSIQAKFDISINDSQIEDSLISPDRKVIYTLMRNSVYGFQGSQNNSRSIRFFDFDESSSKARQNQIWIKDIGLNDSQVLNIRMMEIQNYLLVTDGSRISVFNPLTPKNYWLLKLKDGQQTSYTFCEQNQIIRFQICDKQDPSETHKFHFIWEGRISIYQLSLDNKSYRLMNQMLPPASLSFTDGLSERTTYYCLVDSFLVIYKYSLPDKKYAYSQIPLQSKVCTKINKLGSTIHLVCKQNGLQYVAELYFNSRYTKQTQALIVNRYYTQLEDVKNIYQFGKTGDKILMDGDDQLLLTSYSVNRNILLDLNREQNMEKYKGLGLTDIETYDAFSTELKTFAIGVGLNFITFFTINQVPPEVQCVFDRQEGNVKASILIAVNSSKCDLNGNTQDLTSICQTLAPLTFYVSSLEFQKTAGMTITILVLLFVLILILVILGCAFKYNGIRNQLMYEIRKKIQKLKSQKTPTKPI